MKRKKFLIMAIVLIILITVVFIVIPNFNKDGIKKVFKEDELASIGYDEKERNMIHNLLEEENIELLLEYDHIDNLELLINDEQFKIEEFNKYLKLLSKSDIEVKDAIYVVNNNFYSEDITYDSSTIKIIKSDYFINDYLNRYTDYAKKNSDLKIEKIISNVNANLDYEYYTNTSSADLSKGNLILVNKYYKLDSNYVPSDLVTIDSKYGVSRQMQKEAYEAFIKMFEAARKEGLHFYAVSPYRSYSYQQQLYNNYVNSDGKKNADTYSARPGYSEHQTGLAIDVMASGTSTLNDFGNTKEYTWLCKNAHKYGFILRYPKGKEDITGYIYEPWHYRYLGINVATKVYESGLTYDEYYAYYVR